MRAPSLRTRLLVSHGAVALVATGVAVATGAVLASRWFVHDVDRLGLARGRAAGAGPSMRHQLLDVFGDALRTAFVLGVVVALVVAAVVAVAAAARIARPVEQVRVSTRALARGDYRRRVTAPRERELAALADDINTLAVSLETTEQRRVQLLGDVAHELRTPLTTVGGAIDGMLDGIFDATPSRLASVRDDVRRMERLVEDLAALSRAEEGAIALRPATTDVVALVEGAVERLRPRAEAVGVMLRVTDALDDPAAVVDGDRVAQVVTNLVTNAIGATPRGGDVEVHVGGDAVAVEVRVADTGRGIPPGDLERVFERFYRVGGAPGRGGTGIGLTIARAVARAHGGDVRAESAGDGKGATFVLTLPRRPPTAAA